MKEGENLEAAAFRGWVDEAAAGTIARPQELIPIPQQPSVCMVGAFPPPVHGMAMINAKMYEHLCSRGGSPLVLDLAPSSLNRDWFNRLGRVPNVAKALQSYLMEAHADILYVGISGGWGQLYEALFLLVARLRRTKIFIHHHSFAYIEQKKLVTSWVMRLAGRLATHITLCCKQAETLRRLYPTVACTRVISNAAIMQAELKAKRLRSACNRIGFLGNISRDKGIDKFLAIAAQLNSEDADWEMYIAGPFENNQVASEVSDATDRISALHYLGPRYGADKETFWDLIDVLLFPSTYRNETAPLVVYEAMAHGVPVIASERGCLSDMVRRGSGLLIPECHEFVTSAIEQLQKWRLDSASFGKASCAAADEFVRQAEAHQKTLESLLTDLCSSSPA